MWNPFQQHNTELINQAHKAIDNFTAQKMMYDLEKEDLVKRQVELWAVLTPTFDLEEEYRKIAQKTAYLIKKSLCLQDHIRKLSVARYHCQNDECQRLKDMLAIPDPCLNISMETPNLNYQAPQNKQEETPQETLSNETW